MESLNLQTETENIAKSSNSLSAINIDETRTKIEELETRNNTQNVARVINNNPSIIRRLSGYSQLLIILLAKMEDEETKKQPLATNSSISKNELTVAPQIYCKSEVEVSQSQTERRPEDPRSESTTLPQTNDFSLRKKICLKFAGLLQKVYLMQKDKSQELTLQIEDRINFFYINDTKNYKQAIKYLLKLIKVTAIL